MTAADLAERLEAELLAALRDTGRLIGPRDRAAIAAAARLAAPAAILVHLEAEHLDRTASGFFVAEAQATRDILGRLAIPPGTLAADLADLALAKAGAALVRTAEPAGHA